MLKIHGSPLSGSNDEAARFYRNRHAIISFWRPDQLALIIDVCLSFFLDNGAYSAWKTGAQIDFDEFIKWVRSLSRHPRFVWALIPDIIDGAEWANDAYIDAWPDDLPGVPVWHLHEGLGRLERLADMFPMIALGSSGEWRTPGTVSWWQRIAQAMDVLCDQEGRPRCRLHGLRQLNPAIFTRVPYAGADSANAAINAGSKKRFTPYYPPSASVRAMVIADRIEAHNSPAIWDREAMGKWIAAGCPA